MKSVQCKPTETRWGGCRWSCTEETEYASKPGAVCLSTEYLRVAQPCHNQSPVVNERLYGLRALIAVDTCTQTYLAGSDTLS